MSLTPKTVREQVTNRIRDELVSGRFEAGTMLRETELAKRFGVSRGPIRDAFIQLSQEGFLAYQANCGVMVRQHPSREDREFIIELRRQIETYVLAKGFSNLTTDSLASIGDDLRQLEAACNTGDTTQISLCDIEFHETLMIACGGEDLIGAWRQLCSRLLLTERLSDTAKIYSEHAAIFDSLKSGNLDRAIETIESNIK